MKMIKTPRFFDSAFRFYNIEKQTLQQNIWPELQSGLWRQFNIGAYLENEKQYAEKVENKQDITNQLMFPNLVIIEPGYKWSEEKNDAEIDYTPVMPDHSPSRSKLMQAVVNYFSRFAGKKIGVHLSGGLDSSIIMAWLHELGIPFTAIGFKSDRWEFRTERRVQELMSEYADHADLINVEDWKFYSHLESVPKTQTPYGSPIMNSAINKAIAHQFKEIGVDVVFSGQGGDSLFVEPILPGRPVNFAIGDEFDVANESELFYAPLGMKLLSPFADFGIISEISGLRIGECHDPQKLWARRYFSDILPSELSSFCYVADMFGLSLSGLEDAKPSVIKIFDEIFDITGNSNFSPRATNHFLETNIFELEFQNYIQYVSRISVAAWMHALLRNDEEERL